MAINGSMHWENCVQFNILLRYCTYIHIQFSSVRNVKELTFMNISDFYSSKEICYKIVHIRKSGKTLNKENCIRVNYSGDLSSFIPV